MRLPLAGIACAARVTAAVQGEASGYSIDSRTTVPGDLFFALPGAEHDGHDFVRDALARGAAGALIERALVLEGNLIQVPDVLAALQTVAHWARRRWAGKVIAVTGSAGKTSTKDIIANLLSTKRKVGSSTGNFNNHIGLPLSLLRIPDEAEAAVLEIGMNRAGEIRALAALAQPEIAVVTNVGSAHLENFTDGLEGVALAKRELVEALPANGVAVLNGDDERVRNFKNFYEGRVVTFGLSEGNEVRAERVELLASGARFQVGDVHFETALAGRHGIRNILAGVAVAQIFGIPVESLPDAVLSLRPGTMRGERLNYNGITIFNDSYNSNPDATLSMIDVLRDTPARRHIAVLGEMLELGRWSEDLHRDVGSYAARCGLAVLVGIRGVARSMVQSAIEQGMGEDAAYFFPEAEAAGEWLRTVAQPGDAILFKGSRGTRVEKALERFLAPSSN